MTEIEFLSFVRGPGFQIASVIFVFGVIVRLFEIVMMGRKPNLAEPNGSEMSGGMRAIVSRMAPESDTMKRSAFTVVAGYIFHIGLFIVIFFFAPHILLITEVTGLGWGSLPTPVVDIATVITIITLLAVLLHRIKDPVMKYLTKSQDYLVWLVTFLPLLTGYIAFHRIGLTAPSLLALHILSVELLMILFPFTKLMHAFTFLLSRWYNGAISGYRGVRS